MIIGITGQSGSGKTTAAEIFTQNGFYHLDCDKLVHDKVHTAQAVIRDVKNAFGDDFVKDGIIDRRSLGRLVFSDKTAYNKLMDIVLPETVRQLKNELSAHKNENILLDAPLLFDYSLDKLCDKTVGVVSDNLVERICERDGITESEAKMRLKNQHTVAWFKEKCDHIIENNGTLDDLYESVLHLVSKIKGE